MGPAFRPREQRGGRARRQPAAQAQRGGGAGADPHRAGRRFPPGVAGSRSRVSGSLRRTLAVRFAATMSVGLLAVVAAASYGGHLFLLGVVLLVTGATFVG